MSRPVWTIAAVVLQHADGSLVAESPSGWIPEAQAQALCGLAFHAGQMEAEVERARRLAGRMHPDMVRMCLSRGHEGHAFYWDIRCVDCSPSNAAERKATAARSKAGEHRDDCRCEPCRMARYGVRL